MTQNKPMKSGRSLALLLGSIAAGLALNILGSRLNARLGLPLFFDGVGTILTALTGGFIPCVTVGFFTNILLGLGDEITVYYCIINLLIAVAAAFCAKKRLMTRFPQVLLAVGIYALIGGVAGGALTWLINGMSFGEGFAVELAASIDRAVPLGYMGSNLLACFLVDVADKLAVTGAALLLYRLVPRRLLEDIRRQSWYLRANLESAGRTTRKRFSLSVKATLVVSLSIAVAITAAIAICILQYHDSTVREYEEKGDRVTAIMADMLDRQNVEELLALGREAPEYHKMVMELENVLFSSPEIKFLYAYRVMPEGCLVVYDMDVPELEGEDPGNWVEYDDTIAKYADLFLAGQPVPADITSDEYGWLLSVYRPVFDQDGELLCYAIADMSMDQLRSDEISFLTKIISLFVGFLVLTCVYSVWLVQRSIIRPINTLADTANRFAYDTAEARIRSRELVETLDIRTGDELENLYAAYRKTTADMLRYIDEVQHKSNQIANLQSGLILVLADMVESRDKNTGDHVKKTAAYVAILLEQMRKDGVYADKLTDSYIYDVVHSAPLHDAGKIKISDAILNKPGKLTAEEFGIMKTHTLSGEDIINMVIDTMNEKSDYLIEAKNLAAFHHERWDGTGYPKGLKGEEIPLSARVMAVADVFDALVSRRSYKEPYPIEKAFDIIRESAGSHFDPKVVEAFFHAEPEIRRVAAMNMAHYDYKQHNL